MWLWLLVGCGGIVVPSSIEWVFKPCARHRQIFTTIYHACLFPSRVHAHHPHPFCDHGRATLLIVVHNRDSICQVPPTCSNTRTPTETPTSSMPGPRSRSGPWVLRYGLGRGPRSALCQSVGSCGPKVECLRVGWRCRVQVGDFDLISCDGLHWHNGIPGLVFI